MNGFGSNAAVFGVVFFVVGLLFVVVYTINHGKVHKALTWPVISGTVVATDIKKHSYSSGRGGQRRVHYEPIVNYTYAVGGQNYNGKRLTYGAIEVSEEAASEKLGQFPQGGPVEVHYNPRKPQEAVLELGLEAGKINLFAGYAFLGIGVLGILVGLFSS